MAGAACLRVNIVGSAKDETKVMLDMDEPLVSKEKISAMQTDRDLISGSYKVKSQ